MGFRLGSLSELKQKPLLAIGLALAIALILFVVVGIVPALWVASDVRWRVMTDSKMGPLARHLNLFRQDAGHYPESLEEFSKDPDFSTWRTELEDTSGIRYTYQLISSNRFSLTATKEGSWFSSRREKTKVFEFEPDNK
jgi:hypothetical protein